VNTELNACTQQFMESEEYYTLCVNYPTLTDSCYPNSFFPAGAQAATPDWMTPTDDLTPMSDYCSCATGYCPCHPTTCAPSAAPTPASAANYQVKVEYTTDETLPSGVTAADLMSSTVYKTAKKTGLAAALSVPASDITITGFTLVARRPSSAARQLSGTTVSVKTSATVVAADLAAATAISSAAAGASAAIKAQTDSAMAAADWSGQSVISSAPTMTAPAVATPVVAGGAATAVGDPHLQNVLGERFDLMQAGHHVLINIPRGMSAENALLRVQADARRLGGHCADMYFQEVNVTGSWAEAKQAGGYHFSVSQGDVKAPQWLAFGAVALKVVHGHTDSGFLYLNLYVKHLARAGFAVGGLLGEDDHGDASTAPEACVKQLSLLSLADDEGPSVASIGEATFA
jgi:hypothetical protein